MKLRIRGPVYGVVVALGFIGLIAFGIYGHASVGEILPYYLLFFVTASLFILADRVESKQMSVEVNE